MNFTRLQTFLSALQKNNNKDWMDANRSEYKAVRDSFIEWLDQMNTKLAALDPDYFDTPGKRAINRINNNLMFHPNKPVYKDHFGSGLDQVTKQGDFYIEIGVNAIFMGGGYWHPSSKMLKSIRDAFDYNGEEFKAILHKASFKKCFGNMIEGPQLKTAPRGYLITHPHIDLLKRKSFAVAHYITKEQALAPDLDQKVIEIYKEMLPFRRYLNQAVTV